MLFVDSTLMQPKLAGELFDGLNQSQIVYCHWKSNESLAQGLVGETDLDILVDRSSFAAIIGLLSELGFKQATVRDGIATPGVLHFYAFDEDATDLIHVHLYSRLLTGESVVKSHVLPCESILLEGGTQIGDVHVPAIEAESAVALLRTFIKKGSLMHTLVHGRKDGPAKRNGLLFRDNPLAADLAYQSLVKCCPAVERNLFVACYNALIHEVSPFELWRLGRRIRRHLRGYARHTFLGRMRAYGHAFAAKLRRMARGNRKNKVLDSGGAVIAFIGGDATGKSTLVSESSRWLGGTFSVRTLHLGKPPHTWLTFPLCLALPIARRLFPSQRHQAQSIDGVCHEPRSSEGPVKAVSLIYVVRALSLAWDRSRLVRKAHRAAAAGEIIFCDRYPSDEWGATDGPRLQIRTGDSSWRTRIINGFARLEHRLYQRNPSPDVALRLHVSIETAKQRNRKRSSPDRHTDEDLEARHEPNRAWKKTGTKVIHDIDTEVSLTDTILLIKKALWESL